MDKHRIARRSSRRPTNCKGDVIMATVKIEQQIDISGWLVDAPQFGFTRSCTEACTFTVGVSEPYGKVTYFKVAAGGRGAEQCAKRLSKGMFVQLAGQLWRKNYLDKQKRPKMQTFVVADSIHQLDKHKGQIIAGLFYKRIKPPDVGYYTEGDGPFDKICQLELDYIQMKG